MKSIHLITACLTIAVLTILIQTAFSAPPTAKFIIGGLGSSTWCSCNGQKSSISYGGSAEPGAWVVEEGACDGDGPCPWNYFGSIGYSGVYDIPAGQCYTGKIEFTLSASTTDVGNCEPSSPTSKCEAKNVPYVFNLEFPGTFSDCPHSSSSGVEVR